MIKDLHLTDQKRESQIKRQAKKRHEKNKKAKQARKRNRKDKKQC